MITEQPTAEPISTPQPGLRRSLKKRHMLMISIGGAVGAGLFLSSGAVITKAGPAAIVSYALAGIAVLFTMRALGEMVVARPAQGAFADYARMAAGPLAGFTVGWLYWYMYVVIIAAEATAGAQILRSFVDLPLWLMSLALLAIMTAVNLASVGSFGEFEFWFAAIKVAAIGAFLVFGTLYVCGLWPQANPGLGNLWQHGGFAPNGIGAVLAAVVIVIFSFGGSEIVTIAAGESAEPAKAVARAATGVVWRVLLFYVGSIFLIVAILPWTDSHSMQSPYVAVLDQLGIPAAGRIMNLVILTAVLSVLNSAIYVTSRMLFALTERGDAPRFLVATSRRGVPVRAILASTIVGLISVVFAYWRPSDVFPFLLNSIGAIAAFVFMSIPAAQVILRRRFAAEGRLGFRMWWHPVLSLLTVAAYLAVLIAMAFQADQRAKLVASVVSLAVIILAGVFRLRARRRQAIVGGLNKAQSD